MVRCVGLALCLLGCIPENGTLIEDRDDARRRPDAALGPDAALRPACTGALVAEPRGLEFGRVRAGDTAEAQVTVRNIGACDVEVTEVNLLGSLAFDVGHATGLLAPGEVLTLTVRFTAQEDSGPAEGTLEIASTAGMLWVPLHSSGSYCVRVNPTRPEFRTVPGGSAAQAISVSGCARQALTVESIAFSHAAFRVEAQPAQVLPFSLGRDDTRSFWVVFEPAEAGVFEGELVLHTGDASNPTVAIPLRGEAGDFCPVADVGSPNPIELPAGAIVVLDGSPTQPSEVALLSVESHWIVVRRPEGSVAQPVESLFNTASPSDGGMSDDPDTPRAAIFLDLAGTYRIELRLLRAGACASTDTLTIEAVP